MKTKDKILSKIYLKEGTHMRELSRALNIGMPTIEHHIKILEMEKLIKKKKEGRNIKLFLNYKNINTVSSLYAIEYARLSYLPENIKTAIFEFLRQLTCKPILTVLFGSYAKDSFNRKSDIDLFLVFNEVKKDDVESKSKAVKYKYGVEISPVYIPFSEFSQKFFDEKDRFMRELKQNKIIISGVEWWVLLENEK